MFELIPVVALLIGSVGGIEKHSFEWIAKVFTNATFQRSILNSLLLAVTSSLLGAVIGTAIGYAITRTPPRPGPRAADRARLAQLERRRHLARLRVHHDPRLQRG